MRRIRTSNRRVLKKRRAKAEGDAGDNIDHNSGSSTVARAKKRFATPGSSGGKKRGVLGNLAVRNAPLQKKQSLVLKKQAQERMVLKEHLADLKKRKMSRVRGEDAKNERRQMSKYIKQLRKQQIAKHANEITAVHNEQRQEMLMNGDPSSNRQLGQPFKNMHRRKQQRYLQAPVTVGLPHGRSAAVSATATPLPSNTQSSVQLMVSTANSKSLLSRQDRVQQARQGQEHQRGRWGAANSNHSNAQDEWIDDETPQQQNQNQFSGGASGGGGGWSQNQQQQPANADQLRQLFSGFGGM